jgi:ataxin-3
VIQKALIQYDNIQCIPLDNKQIRQTIGDYADEKGFICHSVDHWLAIRKVNGVWYNLNSTNMVPSGPQIISNFYLSAFLDSIMQTGYTIFVIRNDKGKDLPSPKANTFSDQFQKEG